MSPLPFGVHRVSGHRVNLLVSLFLIRVSIAFRRSPRQRRLGRLAGCERGVGRLHCLSAFTASAATAAGRSGVRAAGPSPLPFGVHRVSGNPIAQWTELLILQSPLPFGVHRVSGVGREGQGPSRQVSVSIAFRRSPRQRRQQRSTISYLSRRSPLPFGVHRVSGLQHQLKVLLYHYRLHCLSAFTASAAAAI